MKKVILLGGLTLVLFALSAAASWYLKGLKPPSTTDSAKDGKASAEKVAEKVKDVPLDKEMANLSVQPINPLRSAVRPDFVGPADEAVAVAERLRQQNTIIREKEAKLADRQKSMELVYGDVKSERSTVDEMRKQVGEELKAVEEKMLAVERKRTEAEKEFQKSKADLDARLKDKIEMVAEEEVNFKKIAETMDQTEPEIAAKILEKWSEGKIDIAVKILAQMKERNAAKVIAAIPPDKLALAAELLEKMQHYKRPPATKKKP